MPIVGKRENGNRVALYLLRPIKIDRNYLRSTNLGEFGRCDSTFERNIDSSYKPNVILPRKELKIYKRGKIFEIFIKNIISLLITCFKLSRFLGVAEFVTIATI